MVKTLSTMLPLGTKAPLFNLFDVVGQTQYDLETDNGSKATVIMFICNHCPYVKHINQGLVSLANDYKNKAVSFIAINSNDTINYPDDSPEKMKAQAELLGYPFPYLFDDTQDIAKAYHAACTPDFFVFDDTMHLAYRGQLDSSRPGNNEPVTGSSLRHAIDGLIEGRELLEEQLPSLGCNIKWRT